jgi:hypothetical protein
VTIGIVDSGIDTTNAEFAGRISAASADVAGTRSNVPDDDHGTLVALVSAGARNNSGVMGIAYEANIMMLRADAPGSCTTATGCSFFDSAITAGVDRAVATGAKVINLSLGGSAPSTALRSAIGQAANAGVVVVVSSGNDADNANPSSDPNNPEPFAIGLRQAGNGNVIIAGSVDNTGTVSAFSNKAGTEANSYLMALGDGICCVYSGSNIQITTVNGQQFISVVSGSSFSAPQISGAVALLRQAFPNLTAIQTVNLLLSSARDAGAAGTDAIYGRGILDIGNAFAPKGTLSLASSLVPLAQTDTIAVVSPAMGDSAHNATLSAVMLDIYERAYRIQLGNRLQSTSSQSRLGSALLNPMDQVSVGAGAVSLGFSVDRRGLDAISQWQGKLRLSRGDAEAARVMAAQVAARIAPHTSIAFGFAQGADGLVAQVQGHSEPAFLVARSPSDDFGFVRSGETSVALRQQIGSWGLTISADSGKSTTTAAQLPEIEFGQGRYRDRATRIAVSADHNFGALLASLSASWLAEGRTVLGARLHDAFGAAGADSLFVDARVAWPFAPGWRLGAAWRQGFTQARISGLLSAGSRLSSNAWSIDLEHQSLFSAQDTIAFRLAQPLRVQSGGLNLNLPNAYDYETRTATSTISFVNLSPRGREITGEMAWHGPFLHGAASASLFYRHNPGNFADVWDDKGAAISWKITF